MDVIRGIYVEVYLVWLLIEYGLKVFVMEIWRVIEVILSKKLEGVEMYFN